jgi:ribosomal protein S14
MIFKQKKDIRNRKLFKKSEIKKLISKFIIINLISNPILIKTFKNKFLFYNDKIFKNSKIKMKGRCILTNRKGSIDRKFLLSRIVLRDLMQFGIIPGFKKAIW